MLTLERITALAKVGSFLLEMADRSSDESEKAVVLPMSRYDIADHLGLAVETVSRALTDLKHSRAITLLGAHRVKILDGRALEENDRDGEQEQWDFVTSPRPCSSGLSSALTLVMTPAASSCVNPVRSSALMRQCPMPSRPRGSPETRQRRLPSPASPCLDRQRCSRWMARSGSAGVRNEEDARLRNGGPTSRRAGALGVAPAASRMRLRLASPKTTL
jgi:Crp-like helix-turn-helix protein